MDELVQVQDLLAVIAFWEVDLPDFGCEMMLDFHVKLVLRTLFPIGLLILLGLLAHQLRLRRLLLLQKAKDHPHLWGSTLKISYGSRV